MSEDRIIFETTDDDGDQVRITATPDSSEDPNLILRSLTGGGSGGVSVRLYPGKVQALTRRLTDWLLEHAPSQATITANTDREPVTEPAQEPDPVRKEALRMAVRNPLAVTTGEVLARAREFENYLRLGGQVEPELDQPSDPRCDCVGHWHARSDVDSECAYKDCPCGKTEPEPGTCPECGHPVHGTARCWVEYWSRSRKRTCECLGGAS